MDVIVVGGDRRSACLTNLLRARGLDARALGLERAGLPPEALVRSLETLTEADLWVMNAPLNASLSEVPLQLSALLSRARAGAKILFAGPSPAPSLWRKDLSSLDLSRDEAFLQKNARLTAEGALWSMMERSAHALAGSPCLVIGWGRIGSALAELLVGLGAKVRVASRSPRGRGLARGKGAEAVDTARMGPALAGARFVFSTPPARVLDEAALALTRSDVRILDLSSPPYGVDLEAAARLGRMAWREPGLPGRYCPETAAEVLAEAVDAARTPGEEGFHG